MIPESQVGTWEWYYIALYFFIGGVSAGAYFIGSLVELVGSERHRDISKIAFYIAFPVILLAPVLLIADLGRPERFWHLFYYANGGIPAFNFISPLSVGSWALMVFGAMTLLSFLDNLIQDGYLKFAPFANVYNRIPRKLYALIGSLAGFFVAGYTGVLIDLTARPMWAAMDPLLGFLFLVSAGSTGAAAIALVMAFRRMLASDTFERLETFDNLAMLLELALIVAVVLIAGQFVAPLFTGIYAVLFWGGTVLLGLLVPLALNLFARRSAGGTARLQSWVVLASVLILLGGALLRISLITAGQAQVQAHYRCCPFRGTAELRLVVRSSAGLLLDDLPPNQSRRVELGGTRRQLRYAHLSLHARGAATNHAGTVRSDGTRIRRGLTGLGRQVPARKLAEYVTECSRFIWVADSRRLTLSSTGLYSPGTG